MHRADDVAQALAAVEHRRRKGGITERQEALTRMRQLIKDDAGLQEAARVLRKELSDRWMQEFTETLSAQWMIARYEARRRGGADTLAVHRVEEREKKVERVREEALMALLARKSLTDSDFRLIYLPAGRVAPLGRIEGWGRYGPNTAAVKKILVALGHLTLDDWVHAALTFYRLEKERKAAHGSEIAGMRYGLTSDPLDRRDTEADAAEAAAVSALAKNWHPGDTRSWWQRFTGDRSQERLWKWREKKAAEACRVAIGAAIYADRLPATTLMAAFRPFEKKVDVAELF